jgi:DNA-binding CsgD family transcriptional regulator
MADPALLARDAVLLERDAEVAAIEELVEATRDGAGGFLVVEAPAGVGKTRLLAEVRRAGAGAGLETLLARGGELEREFAFGVVRQLFEQFLALAPERRRRELTGGAAALALPLFDDTRVGAAEPAASFATLHGLYWLAANIALEMPTALIVDDVHWADDASLRWLAYLVRRLDGLPLLVAVATRPPEHSPQPFLLAEVLAGPDAQTLRPQAFGPATVAALVRDAFAERPDVAFIEACERATGGNPLFLKALLETLAAEHVAPTAASAARVGDTGPNAVARSVSIRLAHLPPDATGFARAAAVLGDGSALGDVAALARFDIERAARAGAALVKAEILRRDEQVEFVHPVVRAAVYTRIETDERIRAHRRAATLLADSGAPPEQAAAHLLAIPPANDPTAVALLLRAADRSLAQGAPAAAVTYLRRALDEGPEAGDRRELLGALGTAELNTDAFAAAEHLREALALTSGRVARADAALLYVKALTWIDAFEESVQALDVAINELGDEDAGLRELLEAVLVASALWTPALTEVRQQRVARVREDELGTSLGAAVMRSHLAWHHLRAGVARERAVRLARTALETGALASGEQVWTLPAIVTLQLAGEHARADAAFEGAIGDARARGDVVSLVPLLLLRGWLRLHEGDLLAAEEELESPEFDVAEDASTTAAYRAGILGEVRLEQGRLDDAQRVVEALRTRPPTHSEYRLFYFQARGRVLLELGRTAEALDDFRTVGREAEALAAENPSLVAWRSHAALALRLLGRTAEAERLADEELALARRWGAPRAVGIALRALGLVSGGADGEQLLREAVAELDRASARLEHARALADLGAALRRRNRRVEARRQLRDAIVLAHRCGAQLVAARAREELAAAGGRPRRVLASGIDALTPSERRVARMAADGLSNKEIAQALFVTVKAVEVHLSSVYRKLEIASRRDLGAALSREDELETQEVH